MTLFKKLIIKILNLKLLILLEYQNIKIFLRKVILQTGLKDILIKKVKNTVLWTDVVNDHNGEEIIETFYGKDL